MCKIIAFTNSKNLDIKKASNAIGNIMLKIEPDGFGYAVQGISGAYGEKCIADKFKSRIGTLNFNPMTLVKKQYETFGNFDTPIGPAIFHGRTSTNDAGLTNCHPMRRESWHLIHNGVVDDDGPKYNKNTTNDSESVLHRLISGIDHVAKHLSGYYAFAAISPDGRLHIGRDKIATLHIGWSQSIESFVIGTTESLINDVAKALDIEIDAIDAIDDDTYSIFDGNDMVHIETFKSRGYDSRQSSYAQKSLGRSLDGNVYDATYDSAYDYAKGIETIDVDSYAMESYDREIDTLDDSYDILDADDIQISAREFRQLTRVEQRNCTIVRPDGSYVEYWSKTS